MFSKLMDYQVDGQFRKDPSGRLVFLPFSSKGKAYFVDSKSDEDKIRAFVKMYRSATVLMSWMAYPGIYVGTMLNFYAGATPLRTRLEAVAGISLFFLLVFFLLLWVLWGVYKKTVPSLTSSLSEVGPELKGQLRKISPAPQRLRTVALLCVIAIIILLMGAVILATSRHSRVMRSSSSAVCPPTAHKE